MSTSEERTLLPQNRSFLTTSDPKWISPTAKWRSLRRLCSLSRSPVISSAGFKFRKMNRLVVAQENELFVEQVHESVPAFCNGDPQISRSNKQALQKQNVSEFLSTVPIRCVPELPSTLLQSEPPPYSFFKSLPNAAELPNKILRGSFLVYALCLKKPDCMSVMSIGSACNADHGALTRVMDYVYVRLNMMPKHVKEALEDGYEIVHTGVLLLFDIPRRSRTPEHRLWGVHFEAKCTYNFWTVYAAEMKRDLTFRVAGHKYAKFCPWDRTQFDYRGLNGHSPLRETVHNLDLSPEDLAEIHAQFREKRNQVDNRREEAVKKTLESYEAGEIDKENISPEVQKLLDRGQSMQNYQPKYQARIASGLKIMDDMTSGKITSLTAEQEELLKVGEKHVQSRKTYKTRVDQGKQITADMASGKITSLTAEQEELVEVGKENVQAGKNFRARVAQGKQIMADMASGKITSLTAEQEELVKVCEKRIQTDNAAAEKRNAKNKRGSELVDAHRRGERIDEKDQDLLKWTLDQREKRGQKRAEQKAQKTKQAEQKNKLSFKGSQFQSG